MWFISVPGWCRFYDDNLPPARAAEVAGTSGNLFTIIIGDFSVNYLNYDENLLHWRLLARPSIVLLWRDVLAWPAERACCWMNNWWWSHCFLGHWWIPLLHVIWSIKRIDHTSMWFVCFDFKCSMVNTVHTLNWFVLWNWNLVLILPWNEAS